MVATVMTSVFALLPRKLVCTPDSRHLDLLGSQTHTSVTWVTAQQNTSTCNYTNSMTVSVSKLTKATRFLYGSNYLII